MAKVLAPRQFKQIAAIAMERWGLNYPEHKHQTVESRIMSYVRKSKFETVNEYVKYLETADNPTDLLELFDVLSTNTTKFFRDPSHLAYLEREFYTSLSRGNTTLPNKRIRIWSAACSTGCEPYSLAINAIESMPSLKTWDFKILATDLSTKALNAAKDATYRPEDLENLSDGQRKRFFKEHEDENGSKFHVKQGVRDLVSIRRLNLNDAWPVNGPFQVIFCCNVMIYFNTETRKKLVQRFYDVLMPGGILAVGSAETLSGLGVPFKSVQANVYVK